MTLSPSKDFICFLTPIVFQPRFKLTSLLESLDFDRSFKSGRKARLFGSEPYGYGNSYHLPLKFTDNLFVSEMFNFVDELFPFLCLNSCLINYYPDARTRSFMPDHSDNEVYIKAHTFIVTISLGSCRNMVFKERNTGTCLLSIKLKHGDILIFSKESQSRYTHGIPPSVNFSNTETFPSFLPRISATFRRLQNI